ncbi:uncharacterized protein LOC126305006 [Schistocerca gregaria]|uniref:uncharacterized protein LOC126305006 n=1 Tax=Schistocerca gregaria TaxID=7010 RepID=UPI00211E5BF1|nr:uncharacterized protein LOC126305006 [Schistocerca gregaria]
MSDLLSMVLVFSVVWISRLVTWTERRIMTVQVCFGILQVAIVSVLLYIYYLIRKRADSKMIKARIHQHGPTQSTELISVMEYDLMTWNTLFFKGTLIQIAAIGFISYKFNTAVPLLTQGLMSVSRLWANPLFKSHILKRAVQRPFPEPSSPWSIANMVAPARRETPQ